MVELGFFEIGGHPDIVRHQRHQVLPDLDIITDRHVLVGDVAGHGRREPGVGEIELRLLHLRRRRLQIGLGGLDLCLGKCDLGVGCVDLALCGSEGRRGALGVRDGVVELLLRQRRRVDPCQLLIALNVDCRIGGIGLGDPASARNSSRLARETLSCAWACASLPAALALLADA